MMDVKMGIYTFSLQASVCSGVYVQGSDLFNLLINQKKQGKNAYI